MTDEQNKPDNPKLSAGTKLPGLGRPSNAPLPGLGGKLPGLGGKPLPGLGRPSSAPGLPGLGGSPSKPPGAGPGVPAPGIPGPAQPAAPAKPKLPGPGMGMSPAIVPPFMQQPEAEKQPAAAPAAAEPAAPSPEAINRDPFGAPPPRPVSIPAALPSNMGFGDSGAAITDEEAGQSKTPFLIAVTLTGLLALLVGYLGGKAYSGRVELSIAIRDARIVEYELKKAATLFGEVQAVVSKAMNQANKREYEKTHLAWLKSNVHGNPVKPTIFTERNYKRFDAAAVQWMVEYNNKWDKLDGLIQTHRRNTDNDKDALQTAGEEFQKLLATNYGVVFSREKEDFVANLVVLGAPGKDEGSFQVQADTGTYADERKLYKPEPGDAELTKEPAKYVVALGPQSKTGLLKNATQSHFQKYAMRLKEISDLMKGMEEMQTNLLNKISEICSQEPPSFLSGIDVEEEVAAYIAHDSESAGAE